ncbi:hypothetical protein [Promicromonospora sukumoe]|uniref:hypothetical protein n=1 Tax=Promicromonospora sukumoe TaxID=88382 RepID=UPI0036530B9E
MVTTRGDIGEESKGRAVEVLRRLYSGGLMVPGRLGEIGFEDRPGAVDEWLSRSRDELGELNWEPKGAGFRLRLADQGKATAIGGPGTRLVTEVCLF